MTTKQLEKLWQKFTKEQDYEDETLDEFIKGYSEAWILDEFLFNILLDKSYGVSNMSNTEYHFVINAMKRNQEKNYLVYFESMDLRADRTTTKEIAEFITRNETKTF